MNTMKIKILDVASSHVSFKYLLSNSKSRMNKSDFLDDYNKGIFNVVNPQTLTDVV
jgi:hypothetical protein